MLPGALPALLEGNPPLGLTPRPPGFAFGLVFTFPTLPPGLLLGLLFHPAPGLPLGVAGLAVAAGLGLLGFALPTLPPAPGLLFHPPPVLPAGFAVVGGFVFGFGFALPTLPPGLLFHPPPFLPAGVFGFAPTPRPGFAAGALGGLAPTPFVGLPPPALFGTRAPAAGPVGLLILGAAPPVLAGAC